MSRLTATDALFAYADTPVAPMNMGSVLILQMPAGYREGFFEKFRGFIGSRIGLLPKLKKRLVVDGIGLPVWLDCDDFDLDYHVRLTSVRSEDQRELYRKLGRLQHKPFDRSKPLFMFYVIEGLKDNRIAIMQKFHHAFADGKTAVRLLDLFSDAGIGVSSLVDDEPEMAEYDNSFARILGGAAEDMRRTWNSLPGMLGAARRLAGNGSREMVERLRSRPVTRFNNALSHERQFAFRDFSLNELNTVRRAAGLTFNDMGLAVLAGALRRYLEEIDQLPGESLVCNVPVALQMTGSETGNAVMAIWVRLGTDIENRVDRAAFIKSETTACKKYLSGVLEGASEGKGIQLPSLLVRSMALPMCSEWLLSGFPPPGNVALSNVPSPAEPIFVLGTKVESLYGMPMVLQRQGVSVTFSSYAGKVVSSILCCEHALPDPDRLFDYMQDELDAYKRSFVASTTRRRSGTSVKKNPAPRKRAAR